MSSLSHAAESLIAALHTSNEDLISLRKQLSDEFSKSAHRNDVNAMQLLSRIHKLQREVSSLQGESQQILALKNEFIVAIKQHLIDNTENIQNLELKAGLHSNAMVDTPKSVLLQAINEFEEKEALALK